jgi:hypothetical protein
MNNNLKLLKEQAVRARDLVKCENINELYVNTFHQAGCTYSVEAMGWIFASSLVISVCGLIMIMLRSAYYPVQHLDLGDMWIKSPTSTERASDDSYENSDPISKKQIAKGVVPEVRRSSPPMFVAEWDDENEIEIGKTSTV